MRADAVTALDGGKADAQPGTVRDAVPATPGERDGAATAVRENASVPAPAPARADSRAARATDQNDGVNFARIGWLTTVVGCLVAVVVLALNGYRGYAAVTFAVAVSAAINLT